MVSDLICLSVCLSVRLSICPSVHLSVCPSVCLSVCLSVCTCHGERERGQELVCTVQGHGPGHFSTPTGFHFIILSSSLEFVILRLQLFSLLVTAFICFSN